MRLSLSLISVFPVVEDIRVIRMIRVIRDPRVCLKSVIIRVNPWLP